MTVAGSVPGVPQRVAIHTQRMPIKAIPAETGQLATVRDRGAALAAFGVRTAAHAAQFSLTVRGAAPPLGSTVSARASSGPVSKEGRASIGTGSGGMSGGSRALASGANKLPVTITGAQ